MALANPKIFRRIDLIDGGKDIVIIHEGFAHPHEHNVLDWMSFGKRGEQLPGDLMRGQLTFEPHDPGEAKLAVHGAAALGGNAQGGMGFFKQNHHFNQLAILQLAILQFEHIFDGGFVSGGMAFDHF